MGNGDFRSRRDGDSILVSFDFGPCLVEDADGRSSCFDDGGVEKDARAFAQSTSDVGCFGAFPFGTLDCRRRTSISQGHLEGKKEEETPTLGSMLLGAELTLLLQERRS